jgi:hypothetical protein
MTVQGGDRRTGVVFESLIFRGEFVEVSFTEEAERGDQIAMVKTMAVNAQRHIPVQLAELIEALMEFVDAAQVALRNPPNTIPG